MGEGRGGGVRREGGDGAVDPEGDRPGGGDGGEEEGEDGGAGPPAPGGGEEVGRFTDDHGTGTAQIPRRYSP